MSNVFACYVALLHAQLCNEKTQTLPKEVLNRGSFKGQPYDVIVSHVVFTVFSVMCLWYWKKKKQRNQKIFYQPVRNRTTVASCWAKISQCHLQDTLAMWQESSRKKLLWRAVEIDTYPVRHPHVKYIPHKHSQPHSHTHKTHMQISRSLNGFREKLREVEIIECLHVCVHTV